MYSLYSIDFFFRNYKVDAEFIPGDLSKASDIAAIGETLGQLYPTGVDILVNNAGTIR